MGIFFQPPPPQLSPNQSIGVTARGVPEAVFTPVNNPPFNATTLQLIEAKGTFYITWTPVQGKMPAAAVGFAVVPINSPPFSNASSITADWSPDYTVPRPANYPWLGQAQTPPAFNSITQIVGAWSAPFAFVPTPAPIAQYAPPVNNPPFPGASVPSHVIALWQQQWGAQYAPHTPQTPAVVNAPSPTNAQSLYAQYVSAWVPPFQLPQSLVKLTPLLTLAQPLQRFDLTSTLAYSQPAALQQLVSNRQPGDTRANAVPQVFIPAMSPARVPLALSAYPPAYWAAQSAPSLPQGGAVINPPPIRAVDYGAVITLQWVKVWGAQSAPHTPIPAAFDSLALNDNWVVSLRYTQTTVAPEQD